ncbi:MAG: NAD(P)H-dependent oxidoreductase [Pseudomonadota bacterium]
MHLLIVIDHYNPASFSHAVAARFADGARAAGHTVEIADLRAEEFDPRWQAGDDRDYGDADRPADVQAEQARVDRADAFCLVFPLWWWGMPSTMKGWIDRVFCWGWAYDQLDDPTPAGSMLPVRPCVLLVPAGASPQSMAEEGFDTALHTQIVAGTLGFFGMAAELHVLHGTLGKPERREAHLQTAYRLGHAIAAAGPKAGAS